MLTNLRGAVADFISPEFRNERRRLERLANFDALTGLASVWALELALPTAESDDLTSVILIDADNFGKLNKYAGHTFGNLVIQEMAATIRAQAAIYGVGERVFRFGGDEFVILCPTVFAELLRDNIERSFGRRYPAVGVSLTGSVAGTLDAADSQLQERKAQRKRNNGKR
jgi:GGDEF domain-containing protein